MNPRTKTPIRKMSARKTFTPGIGIKEPGVHLGEARIRLQRMKSALQNRAQIGARRRTQLMERMILAAMNTSSLMSRGQINLHVLKGKVGAETNPTLFTLAFQNLVRKNKIIPQGSNHVDLVMPASRRKVRA